MNKLNLDDKKIAQARKYARNVAEDTQNFIDRHTTVAIERSVCRLLGIDGVDSVGVPLPNVVVEHLVESGLIGVGAAIPLGAAMEKWSLSPQEVAEKIGEGELDLSEIKLEKANKISEKIQKLAETAVNQIKSNRNRRTELLAKYGDKETPLLYVIVASGNIYEDVTQAVAAAKQGADVIAVIRSTGQSLLDYVPHGATTEGFGGTYATRENFRIMRAALDEVGEKLGRYIRLCNYASGLCMPEIAVLGALERLDIMLNDAFYGILFRDINPERTLIDQSFSRQINGFAGIIINTGEDNYLTTADAIEEAHTVLTSQFLNEQFALMAGLPEEQMGLGHAFEIDPSVTNGFLYELAQAQMAREIFPKAPLKYMPPTKFMTGDIFRGMVQNALFNMVTVTTGQRIHLLGMLTEAIHTPFMSDRALSIDNAEYIFNTMKDFGDEIIFRENGKIYSRAHKVLDEACELLAEIEQNKLFATLEKGIFAGVKRKRDGGKGREGVFEKSADYFNPFPNLLNKS
ncbi:MAG: lysine 5,6-aminomutase subunit alpha [Turicibacter sp.]|nr:lysine 5,6-aminomutase subunit alpha [Turicibacter sp.]